MLSDVKHQYQYQETFSCLLQEVNTAVVRASTGSNGSGFPAAVH